MKRRFFLLDNLTHDFTKIKNRFYGGGRANIPPRLFELTFLFNCASIGFSHNRFCVNKHCSFFDCCIINIVNLNPKRKKN